MSQNTAFPAVKPDSPLDASHEFAAMLYASGHLDAEAKRVIAGHFSDFIRAKFRFNKRMVYTNPATGLMQGQVQ